MDLSYMTEFRVEATKIARKNKISMVFCSEKLIEITELDDSKARAFAKDIRRLNPSTKVTDLIKNNQHIDTRGYDITRDKALYLVDDDYYYKIIGEPREPMGQLSMF